MKKKSGINSKGQGWFDDPARHSLSARGIKTSNLPEAKAKEVSEELNPDEWESEAETEAGKEAMSELAEALSEDSFTAEGEKIDKLKEVGGNIKDKAGDVKDKLEDWYDTADMTKDEILDKYDDLKEWVSEKVETKEEDFQDDVDESVGEILKDEAKKTGKNIYDDLTKDTEFTKSTDETISQFKEEVDEAIESTASDEAEKKLEDMSTKEITDAVRKGDVIDVDSISVSAENKEKLSQFLSNLRRDVEAVKQKAEILDELKDEKLRYYKSEWQADKKELQKEWEDTKGRIRNESDRQRKKNELKNKKELRKIHYKIQMKDVKSHYEYARKLYEGLKNIYKDEKKFIERMIS